VYFNLGQNRILAFNTVGNFNTQGVPFIEMAKVGNDDILRGYARNRFRDLNFVATQAELRFPLWRRFGGVVFTGVGDVFQTPKDLRLDLLKYTYGTGLRFAINSKERLNVRFDYGWGRGEQSFYITLTEAF
jgi:outer membrane translocation and assembly module TamA